MSLEIIVQKACHEVSLLSIYNVCFFFHFKCTAYIGYPCHSLYLSRNVKIASKPKSTPFTMDRDALISARSRVRVLKENSQASIIKTPLATKRAQPKTLKNISMRLCIGARISTPVLDREREMHVLYIVYRKSLSISHLQRLRWPQLYNLWRCLLPWRMSLCRDRWNYRNAARGRQRKTPRDINTIRYNIVYIQI